MKIKLAVEFEVDIGGYTHQKVDVLHNKIINAVQEEHKNMIPTGEWSFMTDCDRHYPIGIFYDDY